MTYLNGGCRTTIDVERACGGIKKAIDVSQYLALFRMPGRDLSVGSGLKAILKSGMIRRGNLHLGSVQATIGV
jgi:hypothetical protein